LICRKERKRLKVQEIQENSRFRERKNGVRQVVKKEGG